MRYYPDVQWQHCTVHFYRYFFSVVPSKHMHTVADMLKAIHACEDSTAARGKTHAEINKLRGMKPKEAVNKIEDAIDETLTFYGFLAQYWRRIRTNNPLERIMREIR